jgi:cysteine synthase B
VWPFLRREEAEVKIIAAEPRYGELVYGLRNLEEGSFPSFTTPPTSLPVLGGLSRCGPPRPRAAGARGYFRRALSGAIVHAALAQAAKAVQAGESPTLS